MVLLRHHDIGAHRTPARARLKKAGAIAAAVTLLLTAASYLIREYNDRPPWADDIAYESGFIAGSRARHYDRTGAEARMLLKGGCEQWRSAGRGGVKAGYNPGLWVEGCRDGAAGRQARKQGMVR